MTPPRVGIVLAVHNGEHHLAAARAQVEALTDPDLQLLLVDDASTDSTSETLRTWARDDPRATLLRNSTRTGVAGARNRALDHVTADYVWFTDCDDEWSPDITARLSERARRTDADVVVCDAWTRRADRATRTPLGEPLQENVTEPVDAFRRLLRGELQGHLWNKLFRRELFEARGDRPAVRFPATRAHSDLAGVATLLARSQRTELLDERLYTYVLHEGSILNSRETRTRDLLDVRDHVRAQVEVLRREHPGHRDELRDDLLLFEYRFVYLALLNDAIRRDRREPAGRGPCASRDARSAITLGGLLRLSRHGRLGVAAPAAAVKFAYPLYAAAYTAYRRRKWGTVGFGAS
ncbi:glycosyltransferase family 2 protein [Kineococcus sp. GCM10028916]|uniref:glycosyltransferase family 2 protein n=1 Tax=Kineococcus sp. GCM10028916 TaxID=3273394 RepID=UPI0036317F8F